MDIAGLQPLTPVLTGDPTAVSRADAYRMGCFAAAKHAGATDDEAFAFVRGLDNQAVALQAFRLGAYQTAKQAGATDDEAVQLTQHTEKIATIGAAVKAVRAVGRAAKGSPKVPKPRWAPTQPLGSRLGIGAASLVGRPLQALGTGMANLAGGLAGGATRALSPAQLKQLAKLKAVRGKDGREAFRAHVQDLTNQGFAVTPRGRAGKPVAGWLASTSNWMRENPGTAGTAALAAPAAGLVAGNAMFGGGGKAEAQDSQDSQEAQRLRQQLELMQLFAMMGRGGY